MYRSILIGALGTTILAFPVAGMFALVFRFPVPFAGYLSGPSAVGPAMMGVVFYVIIGGVIVLPALGAAAGAIGHTIAMKRNKSALPIILGLSLAAVVAVAFVMSILDKLIGPW